jgi:tryptophan-rich sensory protein
MFVTVVNSVIAIGILGAVITALYRACKGKWWESFLSFVCAMMTFLVGAAWSAFVTGNMDYALGAIGMFAMLAVGLVFFFVMQSRSRKAGAAPIGA